MSLIEYTPTYFLDFIININSLIVAVLNKVYMKDD